MSMRFAARTATCLIVALLICRSGAFADSGYTPYYSQHSDAIQFSNVAPPQEGGVEQPLPAAPVQNLQPLPVENGPSSPQWQSQPALYHFNNEVWAAAGSSFLNYKETVRPIPDSEDGEIPSIALGGSYMTHSNLYLSLDGSVSFGNTNYNGALINTQNFTETAYRGTTHDTLTTVDGKLGQGVYVNQNMMLIPYIDVGYRYWDRNLGAGETEDYHNFDTLGGLMVEVTPIDRLLLSAYGSAGTTIGGRMTTGSESFQLGDSAMYKVGGKIGVDMTQRIELFTTLDYDHFHYGKSPVTNDDYEPGSRTEDTTIRVGLAYHLR